MSDEPNFQPPPPLDPEMLKQLEWVLEQQREYEPATQAVIDKAKANSSKTADEYKWK